MLTTFTYMGHYIQKSGNVFSIPNIHGTFAKENDYIFIFFLESPTFLPVLIIHYEDSQGSAYCCFHNYDLLEQKNTVMN